jgi:VanZ family protein
MKKEYPKYKYIFLFFGSIEETLHFKRLIPYWFPVWSWAVFIWFMSSRSSFGNVPWRIDPVWHLFAFAFLAFWIYRAFRSYTFPVVDSYVLAAVGSFLYGVIDEIHQLFVPGRSFSVFDMLTDLTGVLILGLIIRLVIQFKEKNTQST